jgi:hypothetical protein
MQFSLGAKRIALLFSGTEVDLELDLKLTADIPDIKSGDEVLSDGCGLIAQKLAVQLARKKKIMFRGHRYTPCVMQIRLVLTCCKPLDSLPEHDFGAGISATKAFSCCIPLLTRRRSTWLSFAKA